MHTLVTLRRRVPPQARGAYDTAWRELRDAARAAGLRAWRFQSAADPGQFMEFVESPHGADPRAAPAVDGALARLAALSDADAEIWRELREPE